MERASLPPSNPRLLSAPPPRCQHLPASEGQTQREPEPQCGCYPREVPRPLIASDGKAWRYIFVLKSCRKNAQCLTLCLLRSFASSLQVSSRRPGARAPSALAAPEQSRLSAAPRTEQVGQGRTEVPSASAAFSSSSPSAAALACAGWGKIPSTKSLVRDRWLNLIWLLMRLSGPGLVFLQGAANVKQMYQ